MAKATKAEALARVAVVVDLILEGNTVQEIVQHAAKMGWGLKQRQIYNYHRHALKLIAKRQDQDRDKLLAKHVARREYVYRRAIKSGRLRDALVALEDMAKLEALYPAAKHEHSGPGGGAISHDINISDADRDSIRDRLLARLGHQAGTPAGDQDGDADRSALARSGEDHEVVRDDAGRLAE